MPAVVDAQVAQVNAPQDSLSLLVNVDVQVICAGIIIMELFVLHATEKFAVKQFAMF